MDQIVAYLAVAAVLLFIGRSMLAGFRQGTRGAAGDSDRDTRATGRTVELQEPAFKWPSIGEFEFEVVGESHHQDALRHLAGDHGTVSADAEYEAVLVPQDDNPHDNKAVAVYLRGLHVGHLSRDDARSFRRRLGQMKLTGQVTACDALIVGGWVDRIGKRMHYGVQLDLKPFE